MRYTKVNLCRMEGKSCFGCCGHRFLDRKELMESIKKNDLEFKNKKTLTAFMQRDKTLRDSGVCRNLVTLKDGSLGCPGHPKQCRRELRTCNILYECKASFLYNNDWSEEKKQRFLKHIKDMDSIAYSLFMADEKMSTSF